MYCIASTKFGLRRYGNISFDAASCVLNLCLCRCVDWSVVINIRDEKE